MAKSDKLYAKSPSVKKDKDGKAGIHKPSKADAESMGISGGREPHEDKESMPVHPGQVKDMHDRHHKEMKSMHERHGSEMKDMHKRHQDEHKKLAGTDAAGESVAAQGAAEGE